MLSKSLVPLGYVIFIEDHDAVRCDQRVLCLPVI